MLGNVLFLFSSLEKEGWDSRKSNKGIENLLSFLPSVKKLGDRTLQQLSFLSGKSKRGWKAFVQILASISLTQVWVAWYTSTDSVDARRDGGPMEGRLKGYEERERECRKRFLFLFSQFEARNVKLKSYIGAFSSHPTCLFQFTHVPRIYLTPETFIPFFLWKMAWDRDSG